MPVFRLVKTNFSFHNLDFEYEFFSQRNNTVNFCSEMYKPNMSLEKIFFASFDSEKPGRKIFWKSTSFLEATYQIAPANNNSGWILWCMSARPLKGWCRILFVCLYVSGVTSQKCRRAPHSKLCQSPSAFQTQGWFECQESHVRNLTSVSVCILSRNFPSGVSSRFTINL